MNISTRQLRAFLLVSQTGSFTKAAEQLHITQAGLSALVRELETQLGFRLFERTTRRVSTTAQGVLFLPVAQSIDQQLACAIYQITEQQQYTRRTLRVAASPIMVSGILPLVLKHHASRFPDDVIELLDVARQQVLPEVEKGHADMGMGLFLQQVSGVRFCRLFSTSLMLVSPVDGKPGARRNRDSSGTMAVELADVPVDALIRLPEDNPLQQWIDSRLLAANNAGAPVERARRLRNIESCIAMVEMGEGHFIAPDFVVPVCKRYSVTMRPIKSANTGVDFYAIQRAGSRLGEIAHDFALSIIDTLARSAIGVRHGGIDDIRKMLG